MSDLVTTCHLPLSLTLPEPPSANTYWRHVGGRVLLSREARRYRSAVAHACLRARLLAPIEADVAVTFRWYRARKAGDLDNRTKQLFDALQGCVLRSDAQIVEIHAYRDDSDRHHPRVEITLSPLSPD